MQFPKLKDYPKQIILNDAIYEVKFVNQLRDKEMLAECDSSDQTIRIKKGLGPAETFRCFIHEVLHLIEFEGPIELKHKTIYRLEEEIFKLFLNNF